MANVLVTGATGLLGCHLVEKLVDRGDSVRAVTRLTSDQSYLNSFGIKTQIADLADLDALRVAVSNIEVVYHCAARSPLEGTKQEYFHDNVIGTENLLKASALENVEHFIHVSTVDVYGYRQLRNADESAPLLAEGFYAKSKVQAESLVLRYFKEFGLPVTILRPSLIFGPYDRNMFPAVLGYISLKRVPLINNGKCVTNVVFAGDVADAMILASQNSVAIGQIYNITDGRQRTCREVVETFAETVKVDPNLFNVPYPLAVSFGYAATKIGQLLQIPVPNQYRWEAIKAMGHDRHFDISKAARDLGYQPQVSYRKGLRMAADWFDGNVPQFISQSERVH